LYGGLRKRKAGREEIGGDCKEEKKSLGRKSKSGTLGGERRVKRSQSRDRIWANLRASKGRKKRRRVLVRQGMGEAAQDGGT